MKRHSHFPLSEVDFGVYSDEVIFSVRSFDGPMSYPLSIAYDPTPPPGMTSHMRVEFGDQNWGSHYGIIDRLIVSPNQFVIVFASDPMPVPWLEGTVTFDWRVIEDGKDLIFNALEWICDKCSAPFERRSA